MEPNTIAFIIFSGFLGVVLIIRGMLACMEWCQSLAQIVPIEDQELAVISVYYVGTGRRLGDEIV